MLDVLSGGGRPRVVDRGACARRHDSRQRHVITGDDAQRRARVVAIGRGRILAAGTDGEVRAHEAAGTRVIDVGGRRVVPGPGDNHFHSAGAGLG